MAASVLFPGFRVPAVSRLQPEAPDAGGFTRADDWSVCLPPQEWTANGDWVMQKTLELLQPDHWHSWGNWPDSSYPGRIPTIFSTQYFDKARVRRIMETKNGLFWMTVNEPEMPYQCNESPEAIADLTCDLMDIGRGADTEWQWGSPSVTLTADGGSIGGLRWLTEWNKVMRRRRGVAKPFAWMIHPYNSGSVSLFHQSMDAWWEWYFRDNQGQGAPVVISEVCAEGSDIDIQADVMLECWKLLRDEEKVKGVFWFATYRSIVERRSPRNPWQHYHLTVLNHETQSVSLTPLGEYWKELHELRTTEWRDRSRS